MSNIYRQLFEEQMVDVKAIELYRETLKNLRQNYWPIWYTDIIMQNYRSTSEPSDVLAFSHVHAWIASGKVWTCAVNIHEIPSGDEDISTNNQKLKNLPEQFTGQFIPEKGRSARNDGYITLQTQIVVDKAWSAKNKNEKKKPYAYTISFISWLYKKLYHIPTSN
jgi:hypothetical protein